MINIFWQNIVHKSSAERGATWHFHKSYKQQEKIDARVKRLFFEKQNNFVEKDR